MHLGRVGEGLAVLDGPHRDSDHHGAVVDAFVDLRGNEALVADHQVARDLEDALDQFRLTGRVDGPHIDEDG